MAGVVPVRVCSPTASVAFRGVSPDAAGVHLRRTRAEETPSGRVMVTLFPLGRGAWATLKLSDANAVTILPASLLMVITTWGAGAGVEVIVVPAVAVKKKRVSTFPQPVAFIVSLYLLPAVNPGAVKLPGVEYRPCPGEAPFKSMTG